MEKSNTIVNGIKLQDGRIIQGYPIQQDAVMEEAKENSRIRQNKVSISALKRNLQSPSLTKRRRK